MGHPTCWVRVRAKAAPLVYDRIGENMSNVSMCQNCKISYKVKFLAYDMKCSPGEGLHKDALGYAKKGLRSPLEFCLLPIAEW